MAKYAGTSPAEGRAFDGVIRDNNGTDRGVHATVLGKPQPRPRRVALVDRDLGLARAVRVALSSAPGWRLTHYTSGQEFLQRLNNPLPDVVLMEWLAAEAADSAFGRQFLQQWPRVPAVALMSQPQPHTVATAIKAGASGCLVKPIRTDQLLNSLKLAVEGRSVLCQQAQDSIFSHFRARAGNAPLTAGQVRIVELLKRGHTEKEIAVKLRLATATVHTHLVRAYRLLGAHNRDQALKQFYH
ncbi:MAG TPA: response regulator transcription factor [Verrucomicrobiae bacterium]|nr:response regulator transcription factor [Verrucomicrobiae bacterium]